MHVQHKPNLRRARPHAWHFLPVQRSIWNTYLSRGLEMEDLKVPSASTFEEALSR